MNITEELQGYVDDANPVISSVAVVMQSIEHDFNAGLLSEAERDELFNDALGLKMVEKAIKSDMDRETALKVFNALREIVGFIPH